MGSGRWDDAAYNDYARKTNYRNVSRDEVFSHSVNKNLDPRNVRVGAGPRKGLRLRESVASDSNPDPTPIIFGLDVTGSMGDVAHQIAKDELPKIMTMIHETGVVSNPHIMFMGIDDAFVQGHGALQVSQFEPDLRIVEQLRQMWIVGNGGGNGSESYDLAWYFAGKHTYCETFEKTGRRGFLFTFGDEPAPFNALEPMHLSLIFGEGNYERISPADSLKAAQELYQVFHVTVGHGGRIPKSLVDSWTKMLGNRALFLPNAENLTALVKATMQIANGDDMESVIMESDCKDELRFAFQNSLKESY